jgi:multiple sugar transport system substrate-binding protein
LISTPGATACGEPVQPGRDRHPEVAKYPEAAAKFIKWFTDPKQQIDFSRVNGPEKALQHRSRHTVGRPGADRKAAN